MNRRKVGELGEQIASAFLALKDYEILQNNLIYARREIDVVARDGHALVAVEVKLRRGRRFGTAVEAINKKKLDRVKLALEGILSRTRMELVPRIDVIAIDIDDSSNTLMLNHIEGVY